MKTNKSKKTTHLILATAISVSPAFTPIVVHAEEQEKLSQNEQVMTFDLKDWIYSETTDELVLNGYTGSSTDLYLPGEWNGKQVVLKDFSIFPNTITSLQIQEVNKKKVKLQTTTLDRALRNQTSLLRADLSGLDVSNVTNMSYLFNGASHLTNLNLSGWETSNVTDMSYMFYNASSLTTLDVSHFDTSNVVNMREMFRGTSQLTALDISGWDVSNVKNMNSMFKNTGLSTMLDLSKWRVSNVENMSYMFNGANHLTTINLNGWDTSNVTTMCAMFADMGNLTSLDLNGWDVSKVEDMSFMFKGIGQLTTLDLSGWNVSNVKNMNYMFQNMDDLMTLDLSGWKISDITNINGMFKAQNNRPLLILTTDERLKAYDFKMDQRTGSQMTFQTHEGYFPDGTTEWTSPEIFTIDSQDNNVIQELIVSIGTSNGIPVRDGFVFNDWTTTQVGATNTLELVYHQLNATYRPQWSLVSAPINQLPVLIATDQTLTVGDIFDPLKRVYAYDKEDGEIVLTQANIVSNNVDSLTPGTYEVVYQVSDSQGATTIKTIQVTVNARPTFIGNDDLIIVVGDPFNPLDYVLAFDEEDGYIPLTETNVIFNDVNPSQAGTYTVIYEVTDSHGAMTQKEISVVVNAIPVIEATDVVLTVGDRFNPLDYATVIDDEAIILTEANIISNNVDPLTPGTYEVTYQVEDSYGAIATKTITVTVVGVNSIPVNQLPIIIATDQTITVGEMFNPLEGVYAYDKEDGEIILTEANIISNNVDPLTPGTYEVVYQVADSQGATTTKTMRVMVQENTEGEINPDDNNNNENLTPDVDDDSSDDAINEEIEDSLITENQPNQDHLTNRPTPEKDVIEAGFSMGSNLLLGLFSLSQGVAFWKRQKK